MTKSVTGNQNDDDDDASWSDINHDVLLLVMMKLGVIDFVSFSGVCKSWRSFALSNRNRFMASRPPMYVWISTNANVEDYFSLKDFEGRKFKTVIPHSGGRKCVGLTCGYLILFGRETKDFWLVNLITRDQLHFPDLPCDFPFDVDTSPRNLRIRAILVFTPSICGWLFVFTERLYDKIWFSIAGKGVWNNVSTTSKIIDLHAFKGKIYTLNIDFRTCEEHLYEMRFGMVPKLVLLKTKNFPKLEFFPEFVSSDENLRVLTYTLGGLYEVHELDFGEMKWVYNEKTNKEYEFYFSRMNNKATAVKRESWVGTDKSRKDKCDVEDMWYFPHDCFNVNLIDE